MRRRRRTELPRDEAPAIEVPHDPLNEQIVIAAVLVSDEARGRLTSRVKADWFHGDGHAAIWTVLAELQRQGLACDPMTASQLSGGKVEPEYLKKLATTYSAAPPNLAHHVAMLEWDHARFAAVRGPVSAMLGALKDPTTQPDRLRALARQVSTSFDGFGSRRFLRDPNVLVDEQMAAIEKRRQQQGCFPYGIDGLDIDEQQRWRIVPGAAPGQVTVVTGVPGSGKSTLAARIALEQARRKRRVMYGAWEMGGGVTLELLACMSLGWSRSALAVGNLSDAEMVQLRERMLAIGTWIKFMEMPFGKQMGERRTNDSALDTIHGYIADTGCDVAVFDLWKRCLRHTEPDDEEQALVRQQAIAEETKCHCILVQQQRSKDIETRPDKRPTREGIKGSGAWVEVADTIIGVHRPALWKRTDDNMLEVDILKQRFARWPLAVECDWEPDQGAIWNGRSVDYDPPGAAKTSELDSFVNGD